MSQPKYLPDGTLDTSEDVGNAFDDFLDELHSTQAKNTGELDATDRETLKRNERLFCEEFVKALDERLRGKGFKQFRVNPDPEGQGYIVRCLDNTGHTYKAGYKYDALLELAAKDDRTFRVELYDQMTNAILGAREKYFARMGVETAGEIT